MSNIVPVTAAYGDGIGPEIMQASLHVIQETGARIQVEVIEIGEKVYLRGNTRKMLGLFDGQPGYTLAQGQ